MAGRDHSSTRFVLAPIVIASLIGGLVCGAARADDLSTGKSFRIRTVRLAPIGRVYSLGEISLNGRAVGGYNAIWNGDVLQVPKNVTAHLVVNLLGDLVLSHDTVMRLGTNFSNLNRDAGGPVLIVSLISGAATISLSDKVGAYVEANGFALSAAKGSSFRAEVGAVGPLLEVFKGKVDIEASPFKRNYELTIYRRDPRKPGWSEVKSRDTAKTKKGRPVEYKAEVHCQDVVEKAYSAAENPLVHVALKTNPLGMARLQSDSKPCQDCIIHFNLERTDLGPLHSGIEQGPSVSPKTDPNGAAFVTFETAQQAGKTKLKATLESTDLKSWEGTIVVEKGFWGKWRNRAILGAIAAVAAALILIRKTEPIRQEGPPQIP